MFKFEKRDEGFIAFNAEGRSVADVTAAEIAFDHNPKFKEPERIVNVLPREKWRVHFCATKLSPVELTEFVKQLNELEF